MLCGSSTKPNAVTFELVDEAIRLKSFDYRLMNALLYLVRKKQVGGLCGLVALLLEL